MKLSFLKKLRKNRGATVIIAITIAALLIAFAFGIGTVVQNTQQNIRSFKESARAQTIAESVMEKMIQLGEQHEAGFSMDSTDCNTWLASEGFFASFDQDNLPIVNCEIKGRHDPEKDMLSEGGIDVFTIPSKNSGDAGKDCNPLSPQEDIDHPCNWGKLNFGSSYTSRVAIPLYYDEGDAGNVVIKNPAEYGLSELEVWVRTPCKEMAEGQNECIEEYTLDLDGYYPGDIRGDGTIVNWQIFALCSNKNCSATPYKIMSDDDTRSLNPPKNSEIFESKINDQDGPELTKADYGFIPYEGYLLSLVNPPPDAKLPPTIFQFLDIQETYEDSPFGTTYPVLQLSIIVNELLDVDENRIPYLEYQVRAKTNTDKGIANSFQVYNVTVEYKGQSYKIDQSVAQEKHLVDFAIQN